MDGYLYAASGDERYLTSAVMSCESLKEYHSDAHVTLVVSEELYDNSLYHTFDQIIVAPTNDSRIKLWGLSRTPYQRTLYIDADCTIRHKDIAIVHDLLGDADIMLTKIRSYAGKFVFFRGGRLEDHCGVFLYNSKPHTIEFMHQWRELWLKQRSGEWQWDTELYPDKELRVWDQWTYWWLMNETEYAIKREYFPSPDARWNFVNFYKPDECPSEDIVIYHHTIDLGRT